MKTFCFTVDDNIRFLKELTEQNAGSLFDHPYPAMLRRLHEKFHVKIQLNLFYRMEGFELARMSDRYAKEWEEASEWLKLSFHSDRENESPYENAGYEEVFSDCHAVNEQILRFASPKSLAKTTTVHYCRTTAEGLTALADNGVVGLLGLFGASDAPRISYGLDETTAEAVRGGATVSVDGMAFASIDMVVNRVKLQDLLPRLGELLCRDSIRIMIHEQYFYEDYRSYQADFEEKLATVLQALGDRGYQSRFFEETF